MKNIILILLTVLNMSCQAQQKNNMNQDKIEFYHKDLVYLKSIPTSNEVLNVTFKKSYGSSKTVLSKMLLRDALSHENTKILDPNNKLDAELLADGSYSPWYTIEFTTAKGNHTINLFLGGLGFMTLPNGKRGAVLFDFSNLKKDEEGKLIKYFKKIKHRINATKDGTLKMDGKTITYRNDGIQINNQYPHPSKEFNENIDIHHYEVKNDNGKISFWSGDTQILETDSSYLKKEADFIATTESLTTQQGTYNQIMRLLKDNILLFPDGLKIGLAYFSHKKTFENQSSPAIAHLELSDKHSEEKWFTIRRDEDTDEQGKFITSYESKKWKNYNIELTGLAYDDYIDIIVTRKGDKNGSKNFIDITDDLSTGEFEQIKNFILKNNGRQTYRNYDSDNPHYAFIDFDLYLGADIGQRNINNDPDISNFNELTIKHNILAAPIKYYQIVIVRKGDINKDKAHILKDMEEDKVYLIDLDKAGLDKLQKQLPSFLKTIKEKVNPK